MLKFFTALFVGVIASVGLAASPTETSQAAEPAPTARTIPHDRKKTLGASAHKTKQFTKKFAKKHKKKRVKKIRKRRTTTY